MTVRVSATDVKAIIETELVDNIIDVYILSANTLVNTALGSGTSDILKEIERWLTSHLIAISKERQASKEGAGGANIEYAGSYGEGLKSTSFGQMVLTLDTTGKMASLNGMAARSFAIKT